MDGRTVNFTIFPHLPGTQALPAKALGGEVDVHSLTLMSFLSSILSPPRHPGDNWQRR